MSAATRVDIAAIIEGQRLSPFLLRLVLVSWIVTFFDGFDMNVIAFAAPALKAEFHLDRLMLGNIFSIGLLGTMIGGFALGWLGDRIGRRPTLILATASFGVITLAFALARGYGALLALRLLDGIAIGGLLPVCWALNIEYAPKRYRATIVTVIMVGYSLGISLAGPVAIWLMPAFGWQSLFVFGGSLSLLAALILVPTLPESIRYLALEGARPERIARLLRRLAPDRAVPEGAVFVVADEAGVSRTFRPALLFKDELRWITPLLWLAYIFSSMAVFFLATWTPLVFEALGFSRAEAAAAGSINALAGALGGLALMRFTDRRGAIAITAMPLAAVPVLLIAGLAPLGHGGFLHRRGVHRLLRHRRPFRAAQHRRPLLSQHLSRQWRGLGDLGRQDRLDRRPLDRRRAALDRAAGAPHLRRGGALPGGLRRRHRHHRPDPCRHEAARGANGNGRRLAGAGRFGLRATVGAYAFSSFAAFTRSGSIGSSRSRLPVSAKTALAMAGAAGGRPDSPTPATRAFSSGISFTSSTGASLMRSSG